MRAGRIIALTVVLVLLGGVAYAADCASGGRYELNGYPVTNGTVTDCRTGLIWLQHTNCTDNLGLAGIDKSNGYLTWYDAMKWVATLGDSHCGLSDGSSAGDWRLPTKTEWMAMVEYAKNRYSNPALTNSLGTLKWSQADAFYDVQSDFYWSSTTYANLTSLAWSVGLWYGDVVTRYKSDFGYVWPVRGGQSGSFGSLTIE